MVLEVNESGEVILPAELVQAPPHTRLQAGREGSALVLKPVVAAKPPPGTSLENWPTFPGVPGDVHATFRREEIYDDGR